MCPIVSACGTFTYNLAKYLTKILKVYIGHTSSFVKDSKDLTDKLKSIKLQDNEELVSFDVSALFTSIPVNQALDVINQLIINHQSIGVKKVIHTSDQIDQVFSHLHPNSNQGVKTCSHIRSSLNSFLTPSVATDL